MNSSNLFTLTQTNNNFTQYEAKLHCICAKFCVPMFLDSIFKHVPKCKWISPTKFPWIPRTNFVGTFVVSRIPQQANIAKLVSGIRTCKWVPQTVSGFRVLFFTELAYEQLRARAGILIYTNVKFKCKDLTIVSGIHEKNFKTWLPKLVDVTL